METPRTKGDELEALAFNFCKAATIILLTGKFALPVAAGAASGLYLAAHLKGKRDTRCLLRFPLLISAFWAVVAGLSLWRLLASP